MQLQRICLLRFYTMPRPSSSQSPLLIPIPFASHLCLTHEDGQIDIRQNMRHASVVGEFLVSESPVGAVQTWSESVVLLYLYISAITLDPYS